jgi:hypothetical protein
MQRAASSSMAGWGGVLVVDAQFDLPGRDLEQEPAVSAARSFRRTQRSGGRHHLRVGGKHDPDAAADVLS